MKRSWSTIALCLLASCSGPLSKQASAPAAIDDSKVVDLTYSFDEKTIYWPTAKPFVWEKRAGARMTPAIGTRQPATARASMAARIWMRRSTLPSTGNRSTRSRWTIWSDRPR